MTEPWGDELTAGQLASVNEQVPGTPAARLPTTAAIRPALRCSEVDVALEIRRRNLHAELLREMLREAVDE